MLNIENVSVSFPGTHPVHALRNVTLGLKPGEKAAIIGETGSGKSVLLLAILQLLSANAQVSGIVRWHERDLLKLTPKELRKVRGAEIAYVPQGGGASLHPLLTVGFQVAEPIITHRKVSREAALNQGVTLLERFHIKPAVTRAKGYPHTYSGGMRQRAMVAMGISAGAQVVLADEPTKGLDEARISQVEEAFHSLVDQAILCVTHDLRFARAVAETICVMYAGEQVEVAPTALLLNEPLHPYTQDMVAALPENGLRSTAGFASSRTIETRGCPYRDRCRFAHDECVQDPPMQTISSDHMVRCWLYEA